MSITNGRQLVENNTRTMVAHANKIILGCIGPKCNVSAITRMQIQKELGWLGHQQATYTLKLLGIPTHSILGRNIYESYDKLSAVVSATYSYRCNNTVDNGECVTNNPNVIIAQDEIVQLISEPIENNTNNIIIITMLVSLASLAFLCFFVFLMFGLVSSTPKILSNAYEAGVSSVVINTEDIALPVSPLTAQPTVN